MGIFIPIFLYNKVRPIQYIIYYIRLQYGIIFQGLINRTREKVMGIGYFYDMPIGRMFIAEDGIGISEVSLVDFTEEENYRMSHTIGETNLIREAASQLREYFDNKRREFSIRLNPKGTEFQKKVWKALLQIPYGETRSYKEIAKIIGNEKASRAVGMANHNNPIMCIIPCHRVIGSNGKLIGYAGGIEVKEKLLALENVLERK